MIMLRAIVLTLLVAGCDQLGVSRSPVAPGPAPAAASEAVVSEPSQYEGRSYLEFVSTHESRFGAEALGLTLQEQARLSQVMTGATGVVLDGGGMQALVFRGCAQNGCGEGIGVVAIDAASGRTFVAVSDTGGKIVLVPDERLEALLRLRSPTRDWADGGGAATRP